MGVIAPASLGVVRKSLELAIYSPDGHILGGSHDDGTELRAKLISSYESLSLFVSDGIGSGYRFAFTAILAGNLDGNIHERSGGCCRGGGIFAVIVSTVYWVSFVFCINSYFSGQETPCS